MENKETLLEHINIIERNLINMDDKLDDDTDFWDSIYHLENIKIHIIRSSKKVEYMDENKDVAQCPSCHTYYEEFGDNWKEQFCSHCGQILIW